MDRSACKNTCWLRKSLHVHSFRGMETSMSEREFTSICDRKKHPSRDIHPVFWIFAIISDRVKIFTKISGDITEIVTVRPDPNATTEEYISQSTEWLNEAAQKGFFDRLILIAPADIIPHLRTYLEAEIKDRIVAEIKMNLSLLNENHLKKEFLKILWFI